MNKSILLCNFIEDIVNLKIYFIRLKDFQDIMDMMLMSVRVCFETCFRVEICLITLKNVKYYTN